MKKIIIFGLLVAVMVFFGIPNFALADTEPPESSCVVVAEPELYEIDGQLYGFPDTHNWHITGTSSIRVSARNANSRTSSSSSGDGWVKATISNLRCGISRYTITFCGSSKTIRIANAILVIDSTPGGSVTQPGEDSYIFCDPETINLVATPDPGFYFVNWIGDTGSIDDPDSPETTIDVERGYYKITAVFASIPAATPPAAPAAIEVEALVEEIEVLEEVQAVRTKPFTVWQVDCNDEGHLEFIFVYPYKDNNWLTIYDMAGNQVYREDISYSNPRTVVDLPDGMYTVKTFHREGHIIQEFMVGLPCGVAVEGVAELPRTGFDYIPYGASVLLAGFGTMLFALRKKIFK